VARIYSVLVLFALALLLTNLIVGWSIGDWNQAVKERAEIQGKTAGLKKEVGIQQHQLRLMQRGSATKETLAAEKESLQQAEEDLKEQQEQQDLFLVRFNRMQGWQTAHFLLGVLAALVTVLVNSVSVTYFIGTTRWCREVVEEYGLDSTLYEKSRRLKRVTYPWALAGVFVMLAIICFGAAADPSAFGLAAAQWVTVHFMMAILGTGAIGWAFWIQIGTVGENYQVIEEILKQVNAIRQHQNLEVTGGAVIESANDEG
jgi:hypothetical protein